MDSVEKEAKTVDDAIELALEELGVSRDEIEIEILTEPSKGFLGMGGRTAKIRVTAEPSLLRPESMLQGMLKLMDVEADIEEEDIDDGIMLKVESPDSAILIGKKGKNLNAIQYLMNLMYNHGRLNRRRIVVDIESYLERRKNILEELAKRTARRSRRQDVQHRYGRVSKGHRRTVRRAQWAQESSP